MNEVAEKQKTKIMEHLGNMSAKQLRILAQQQELSIPSSMRKDEIKDEIFEVLHKRGADALGNTGNFPEDDDIMNHVAESLGLLGEKEAAADETEETASAETQEPENTETQTSDDQLPAEPTEEKTEQSADEKAAHIVEWESKRDRLRECVAEAAVKMTEAKADAKAATKIFDTLTEQLIDHLNTTPEPSLFDGAKICRKCGEPESHDLRFVAPDLCYRCADTLGLEDKKETQQEKQAREVMERCPNCMGKGWDNENDCECEACGGTGKVQQTENEVDLDDLDGIGRGDEAEEVEPVESEEEEPVSV